MNVVIQPGVVVAMFLVGSAVADTLTLPTMADATLVEEPAGLLASGASPSIYAGRVGLNGDGLKRRALLQFGIAGNVPAGATITSVQLTLTLTFQNSGPQTLNLHRTLESWSEGPADSPGGSGVRAGRGDVTWIHRVYPDVFWSTAGGTFDPASHGFATTGDFGPVTWGSTPEMVADVQAWLDGTAVNDGWTLTGNEGEVQTVKQFAAKEWEIVEERPLLTIEYTPRVAGLTGDLNGDDHVDGADLGLLLAAWDSADQAADLNVDGVVDGADLGLLLANWTG